MGIWAETEESERARPGFWTRTLQWMMLSAFLGIQENATESLTTFASMRSIPGMVILIIFTFLFSVVMSTVEGISPELRGIARELLGEPI